MALPRITATGNVATDPELRFTPNGDPVLGFRIACNERRKDANGTWVDGKRIFLNINVWKNAEQLADDISKGDEITVEGRLHEREYEKDGQQRRSIELDADTVARTLGRRARATVSAPQTQGWDEDPF